MHVNLVSACTGMYKHVAKKAMFPCRRHSVRKCKIVGSISSRRPEASNLVQGADLQVSSSSKSIPVSVFGSFTRRELVFRENHGHPSNGEKRKSNVDEKKGLE